jgi:hypothetical protein
MLNSAAGPRSGAGPLHQQQGGVVAQAAALTLEHGPHQAAQQFFARPAAGGFPLQQVDQPVQPELLPVRGPRLGHPVGVQKHHVIRFEFGNARLGRAIAEAERQDRITAELGDYLAPAQQQQQRLRLPGEPRGDPAGS